MTWMSEGLIALRAKPHYWAVMGTVAETVFFVFGLAGLGYVAALTGLLKPETGDGLAEFAVAVSVPALLFRTMAFADFDGVAPWAVWAVYFAAIACAWLLGQITVTRIFGREAKAGVVAGVSASFSNLVLLGIPFIQNIYGQQAFAVLSLIIAVHLPVMMTVSILLFEWAGRGEREARAPITLAADLAGKFLANPLILGILAGLLWRMGGFGLPAPASRIIDALAGVAGTVALFSIGLSLRKYGISGNVKPAVTLAALKLALMPAVALVLALLFGLPPLAAKVAVTAAALPTGVNPYLIASRFGTGHALASNTMTIATGAAVLSTGLWVAVATAVFG